MKKRKIILFQILLVTTLLFYYRSVGQIRIMGINMKGEVLENTFSLEKTYTITQEKKAPTHIVLINKTAMDLKVLVYKKSDAVMLVALKTVEVPANSSASIAYGIFNFKIFKKAIFDVLLTTKRNVSSDLQMTGGEKTFSAVRVSARKATTFKNTTDEELKICIYNKGDGLQVIPVHSFNMKAGSSYSWEGHDHDQFRASVFKPALLDQHILTGLFPDQSNILIEYAKISAWSKLETGSKENDLSYSYDRSSLLKQTNGVLLEGEIRTENAALLPFSNNKKDRIWKGWINTGIQIPGSGGITTSTSIGLNSLVFCKGYEGSIKAKWLRIKQNNTEEWLGIYTEYNKNGGWEDFGGKTDCTPVYIGHRPYDFAYYHFLFIRNADSGNIQYRFTKAAMDKIADWSDWINIGGKIIGKPAVSFCKIKEDTAWKGAFGRWEDNTMRYRSNIYGFKTGEYGQSLDSWGKEEWINLGGKLAGSPAIATTLNKEKKKVNIFVVARFTDNRYYYRYFDGSKWGEWKLYSSEQFVSDPAIL